MTTPPHNQPGWAQQPGQTPPPGYGYPQQPTQPGYVTQPTPGYGYPTQGQPTYPGYPQPPQQPKSSTGKIVGFSCLGVFGVFLLLGMIGLLASGGDEDTKDSKPPAASASADSSKSAEAKESPAAKEKAKPAPVTVTAKPTAYKKSIIAEAGEYTSVEVTITNNTDAPLNTNPLWFTITDTTGGKHVCELGAHEDQMEMVDLAPGEKITGVITGKGKFTPKYVTFQEPLTNTNVRGDVK